MAFSLVSSATGTAFASKVPNMKRTSSLLSVIVMLGLGPAATASEHQIIGEWIDEVGKSWRQNIRIIQEGDRFFRVSTFDDGSVYRADLVELKPKRDEKRRFKAVKSNYGDIYAIDAAGNLEMYDREGYIRKASKIRKTPTPDQHP